MKKLKISRNKIIIVVVSIFLILVMLDQVKTESRALDLNVVIEKGPVAIPAGTHQYYMKDGELVAPGTKSSIEYTVKIDAFMMYNSLVTFKEYVDFINEEQLDAYEMFFTVDDFPPLNYEGETLSLMPGYDDRPARNVTWAGANKYCEYLSRKDDKFIYRLPYEAEWEYVASNYGKTLFPWGDHYKINKKIPDPTRLNGVYLMDMPVNSNPYNATDSGIYDMIGSIEQWCLDIFLDDAQRNEEWQDDYRKLADRSILHFYRSEKYYKRSNPGRVLKGGPTMPTSNFFFGDNAMPTVYGRFYNTESPHIPGEGPVRDGFRWVRVEKTGR